MGWFLNKGYSGLKKILGTSVINSVVKINLNLFHISFCCLKTLSENYTRLHKKCHNIAKKKKKEKENE